MYRVLTDVELQEENPGNSNNGSYSQVIQGCLNNMEDKGWRFLQVTHAEGTDHFYFHKEGVSRQW